MNETQRILAAAQSEAAFQNEVIVWARELGWLVHYEYRSGHVSAKSGKWIGSGPKGRPDLLLARDGRFLGAELKKAGKEPTMDQQKWLDAMGGNGYFWTALDWLEIKEVLA